MLVLPLNKAHIIHNWVFSMLFSDFKALGMRSIPQPPLTVLTELFHITAMASFHPLQVS